MTALSGSATIVPRGATSTRGAGALGAYPSGVESEWAAPASSRRMGRSARGNNPSARDMSGSRGVETKSAGSVTPPIDEARARIWEAIPSASAR